MRTVRRLYVYAVAFVSLEVVTWSLIGLVRSAVDADQIGGEVERLASALALIIVGIPVFAFHWWSIRRLIKSNPQERQAGLRAIFLYGTIIATAMPIAQNVLAFLNKIFLNFMNIPDVQSRIGMGQTWTDNIIAIAINGVIGYYFFRVLVEDMNAVSKEGTIFTVRRVNRYFWLLYGLSMFFLGIQKIIYFLFSTWGFVGKSGASDLASGFALLFVGAPLWYYVQRIVQKSLADPAEGRARLRSVILFGVVLISVIGTIFPGGIFVSLILRQVLGEQFSWVGFLSQIANPISIAITSLIVWFFYRREFKSAVVSMRLPSQQAGMWRLYRYILAIIAVLTAFVGLQFLFTFFIDITIGELSFGTQFSRLRLSESVATLLVAVPVWFVNWKPLVREAASPDEMGDHARRSVLRKAYLYLVLFIAVLGVMFSAGGFLYEILIALLGEPSSNLGLNLTQLAKTLVLFFGLLIYHLLVLREDGRHTERSLSEKHARFPVLFIGSRDDEYLKSVQDEIQEQIPELPLVVRSPEEDLPKANEVSAVIMNSDTVGSTPSKLQGWLDTFDGGRIVIPRPVEQWYWIGIDEKKSAEYHRQAALVVRQLAEDQPIRLVGGTSVGVILAYILGGLFGLLVVIPMIGSLIFDFID